jgi:hypothetical protein
MICTVAGAHRGPGEAHGLDFPPCGHWNRHSRERSTPRAPCGFLHGSIASKHAGVQKGSSGRSANVVPFKRRGAGAGEPVGGWRQERRDQAKSWDQTTTRDLRIGGNKLTRWDECKSRHQGECAATSLAMPFPKIKPARRCWAHDLDLVR